jgi:predicted nucleic acid-binding Zn ribbon protein
MPRGPQAIGNVLSELMSRRGYARVRSTEAYDAAWQEAVGPLVAKYTRLGQLRRGTLEVIVAHSALVQELSFEKYQLLKRLTDLLPDEGIQNLRFRAGNVD